MTVVLDDQGRSGVPPTKLEADKDSEFHVAAPKPGAIFVKVVDADGSIHLLPWDVLDESEKALLNDTTLHHDTREALEAFDRGEGVSSDWLFDDEE